MSIVTCFKYYIILGFDSIEQTIAPNQRGKGGAQSHLLAQNKVIVGFTNQVV